MATIRQTFANEKDGPIYVSIEPWPECFELEPGEKLTLIWNGPEDGDVAQIDFITDNELVVSPNGDWDEIRFLINGVDAKARSWVFKHR